MTCETRMMRMLLLGVVSSVMLAAPGTSGRSAAAHGRAAPQSPASGWQLVVLGIAQDGGIPHLSCRDAICTEVWAGRRRPEKVASVGLVHGGSGAAYLFDATPDFRAQVHLLTGGRLPDAIFLTHAHIGHYTGLMYLGRESIAAREQPVYGTRRMVEFLTHNGPWSLLVKDRHIDLRTMDVDRPVALPAGIRVTAIAVPHRDEFTDTVGFLIEGPRARVLYVPDTDRWETWPRPIRSLVDQVDLAFLDGTFASADELGGRSLAEIPHPLIPVTRALLAGTRARVWFIHLNHSNRELLTGADVAREGMRFPI